MKIMFASDLHGSCAAAENITEKYVSEKAEKLVLLGDLLNHGPRNPFPDKYDPQTVSGILNSYKNEIICVRGNCDSEVDQMLFDFPIMSDFALLYADGMEMFITHGHLFNEQKLPPLKKGSVLIHGHTHIPCINIHENYVYINPGSAALPHGGFEKSYMVFDNGKFSIKDFCGKIINEYSAK